MSYKFDIDINYFNKHNNLKLDAYPSLLSAVAYDHLKGTDQGVGVVILDKYAWVLVSMKIEVVKPLDNLTVEGNTWFAGNRGPFYRREYLILNEGEPFIKAASYSVLLNMDTRTIYREKELPFERLKEEKIHLVELLPSFKEEVQYKEVYQSFVTNSMIDVFDHVNNIKYSELAYNALSLDEIKNLSNLKEIELYFAKEMLINHKFSVKKAKTVNKIYIQVYNNTTNTIAFTMVLTLKKEEI